jgi:hypothetical protein
MINERKIRKIPSQSQKMMDGAVKRIPSGTNNPHPSDLGIFPRVKMKSDWPLHMPLRDARNNPAQPVPSYFSSI